MLPTFFVGVAVFVALLIVTFRLGLQRKRRLHIRVASVTLLVVMPTLICLVETVARGRQSDPIAFRVHMGCVMITLVFVAMLTTFGLRLRRKPSLRAHHRWTAIIFALSLLPTVGTGAWLLMSLHDPPPINHNQNPAALSARRGFAVYK